jgi:DNA-binding transcriptional regulator YiaG
MTKEISMTADQYQRIRKRLGFSNYVFHRLIGVSLRQAQRYESGETDVDQPVARLMLMFDRHGVPKDWV